MKRMADYGDKASTQALEAPSSTQPAVETRLLVSDLGWSRKEAAAIRAQLAAFEEDWDAPGMEAYDRHVPDHPGRDPESSSMT